MIMLHPPSPLVSQFPDYDSFGVKPPIGTESGIYQMRGVIKICHPYHQATCNISNVHLPSPTNIPHTYGLALLSHSVNRMNTPKKDRPHGVRISA